MISDVGLTKMCRRLRVPKPSRGYWASSKSGQGARRVLLPDVTAGVPAEAVLCLREESSRAQRPARPELVVSVPEALEHPHKLVSRTAAALKRAPAGSDGRLASPYEPTLSITTSPKCMSRALLLVDTLIKALEARGHAIDVVHERKRATVVVIGGERIEVSLRERLLQTKRPQEDSGRPSWSSRFDYRPSGRLTFAILEMEGAGVQESWSDGRRRLEEKLGSIVLGLEDAAGAAREERSGRRSGGGGRKSSGEGGGARAPAGRGKADGGAPRPGAVVGGSRSDPPLLGRRRSAGARGRRRSPDEGGIAWAKGIADHLDPIGPR